MTLLRLRPIRIAVWRDPCHRLRDTSVEPALEPDGTVHSLRPISPQHVLTWLGTLFGTASRSPHYMHQHPRLTSAEIRAIRLRPGRRDQDEFSPFGCIIAR